MPNLYNDLLGHVVISGPDHSGAGLGNRFDFQLTYEHNARAMASTNPDARYVELPDEINLSDPAKDAYYRQHALVVLPGLGTPRSARTVAVPATRVAWGITVMKNAPNRENAIEFLQLLLGPAGRAALLENGPTPIFPAHVKPGRSPEPPCVSATARGNDQIGERPACVVTPTLLASAEASAQMRVGGRGRPPLCSPTNQRMPATPCPASRRLCRTPV